MTTALTKQYDPLLNNLADIQALAQHFFTAKVIPDLATASQALVKILAGRELGLGPFAAIDSFDIIKGRISPSGNLLAGLIRNSTKYDYRVLRHDNKGCTLKFYLKRPDGTLGEVLGESSFTEEDAKLAGLASGDNYKKYARAMFYNRAMTAGQKLHCPDVTLGIKLYTPDELGLDIPPAADAAVEVNFEPVALEPRTELADLLKKAGTTFEGLCKDLQIDPTKVDVTNPKHTERLCNLLRERLHVSQMKG